MIRGNTVISELIAMNPDTQILVIEADHITITDKILNMGIWVCNDCSKFNNVERMLCKYCSCERMIVKEGDKIKLKNNL